jgi:hypothetical protein
VTRKCGAKEHCQGLKVWRQRSGVPGGLESGGVKAHVIELRSLRAEAQTPGTCCRRRSYQLIVCICFARVACDLRTRIHNRTLSVIARSNEGAAEQLVAVLTPYFQGAGHMQDTFVRHSMRVSLLFNANSSRMNQKRRPHCRYASRRVHQRRRGILHVLWSPGSFK